MFVIYDKNSTQFLRIMRNGIWQNATYATERAAKTAFTKLVASGKCDPTVFCISSIEEHAKIEKTKVVKNLMTGGDVTIAVNTPRSCDPSSELYWSM